MVTVQDVLDELLTKRLAIRSPSDHNSTACEGSSTLQTSSPQMLAVHHYTPLTGQAITGLLQSPTVDTETGLSHPSINCKTISYQVAFSCPCKIRLEEDEPNSPNSGCCEQFPTHSQCGRVPHSRCQTYDIQTAKSTVTPTSASQLPPSHHPHPNTACHSFKTSSSLPTSPSSSPTSFSVLLALSLLLTSTPFHSTISAVTGCYMFPPGKVNPCTSKSCKFGAECMPSQDGLTARCQCPSECPNYGDSQGGRPVCGSNGVDYPNMCELRKESCTSMKNIRVKYYGKCGKSRFPLFCFIYHTFDQPLFIFQRIWFIFMHASSSLQAFNFHTLIPLPSSSSTLVCCAIIFSEFCLSMPSMSQDYFRFPSLTINHYQHRIFNVNLSISYLCTLFVYSSLCPSFPLIPIYHYITFFLSTPFIPLISCLFF